MKETVTSRRCRNVLAESHRRRWTLTGGRGLAKRRKLIGLLYDDADLKVAERTNDNETDAQ